MPQSVLQFDDLTLSYDRHPVVHHLAGEVSAGSLLAIVGPNGAGKSTLLKAIAGEIRPIGGQLRLHGRAQHHIAYLPQQSALDTSFPIGVFDFVAMGLWREIGPFGALTESRRVRVAAALDTVGLRDFARNPIGTLSGGQLQRARFARLLLQNAQLILLDEPYAAVDMKTVSDLAALVSDWHVEGRTVITVLHDLEHVRGHYPETLLLAREPIARGDTDKVLTAENLFLARRRAEGFDQDPLVCDREARRHAA